MKVVEPQFGAASFTCTHCGAVAHQDWFDLRAAIKKREAGVLRDQIPGEFEEIGRMEPKLWAASQFRSATQSDQFGWEVAGVKLSRCFSCERLTLWVQGDPKWPDVARVHSPNTDIPYDVLVDFDEADAIHARSPRGAAALLRLAIEKLCKSIEPDARDLNDSIGRMTAHGLRVEIQQALDVVRVIGNNAVHAGKIDLKDDAATVSMLFDLVNLIVEEMISRPRRVAGLYDKLPPGAKEGIARRDAARDDGSN